MDIGTTAFEIKACELFGCAPHRAIAGRVTGIVRVWIEERFLGNQTSYTLDLKVKADVDHADVGAVRTALLAHAAHQLNRLKARHAEKLPAAAE